MSAITPSDAAGFGPGDGHGVAVVRRGPAPTDAISIGSPVLAPGHTYGTVTDRISQWVADRDPGVSWQFGFAVSGVLVMGFVTAVSWLFLKGVGIWGIDAPVYWGFAIINFVWWVGIGHAGTFISAMLLLMRQDWRTSINRFAEAMTLFAVACAGMFPLLHVGRPWYAYWLLPYPNTMWLWPQFRSPLEWDAFAVSTYASTSLLFWYVGLIPDLATIRDRAKNRLARVIYGAAALGWTGSARHWQRYQSAYMLLGGLCAPLVISVHSVVSMDFAGGQVSGWHSTIFPPYFVAGAIFSGFAMVLTLAIPLRKVYGLEDFITIRHVENCAKVMLATGLIVAYGYMNEAFYAWYSGNKYEMYLQANRMYGPYAWSYWSLIFCNIIAPQTLWIRKVRTNLPVLFVITIIVNIGMWLERFVIIVTSLNRDFMPSAWGLYVPTIWDIMTYAGTIGVFLFLFFLFIRILPVISIFEMRELVHLESGAHGHGDGHGGHDDNGGDHGKSPAYRATGLSENPEAPGGTGPAVI